jgi:hypothetical protein
VNGKATDSDGDELDVSEIGISKEEYEESLEILKRVSREEQEAAKKKAKSKRKKKP